VATRRSFLITLAVAFLLGAAVAGHSAGASTQRHDSALADVIATKAAVTAELTVDASPRRMVGPAQSGAGDRWATNVTAHAVTAKGRVIQAHVQLLVMGGDEWQHVQIGQRLRTTGKLRSPDGGQAEAAILSGTSPPTVLAPAGPWNEGPDALRGLFRESSISIPGDARGLLPGMVTGDTSGLDEGLNAAMKTVGMTHLTAVSGANCSLVLGSLLLIGRSFRLPRGIAAGCALAGLGFFVLVVGLDASVLRAALMGSIGLMALAGGRPGRGLSFLCLAVIGLLLADPSLGASYGFILSVFATLGIVTIGQQLVRWTPRAVPRWVAAGLAVPLSAQLLCSPVIVLLQPQFSPYALIANIVASPLVGPVTILGTAAVPVLPLAPLPGGMLVIVAGFFANCVAGTARFFASLPGASLAWPEGPFGLSTMVLLSCLSILGVWLVLHPFTAGKVLLLVHGALVRYLDRLADAVPFRPRTSEGRPGLVVRRHRGRLRVRRNTSGRNQEWPQPRHHPERRRRTRQPGGM
jgi:competence protein ComEC